MKKRIAFLVLAICCLMALSLCLAGCNKTHEHTLTKTEAKAATCLAEGNTAYWSCADCGKFYSDAQATAEITKDSWLTAKTGHKEVKDEKVDATCTADGKTEGAHCEVCNAVIKAQEPIAAGHQLTKTEAVEATCQAEGSIAYYTCNACGKFYSDDQGATEVAADSWITEKAAHSLTKTEAIGATCLAGGRSAYWTCGGCGKYFADEAGASEVAADSWKLDKNSHQYAEGKCTWCDLFDLSNYNTVATDAPDRYTIYALATDEGLYVQMTQYVDRPYIAGGGLDKWTQANHVEFEVWQGDFGYGWGGTYCAIFSDGGYYINNENNVDKNKTYTNVEVVDRGEGYTEGYRYAITYKMFIAFPNNVGSPDGAYAFVKFYSFTPGETDYPEGLELTRDGRILYSDKCNSYEIREAGVVRKDG